MRQAVSIDDRYDLRLFGRLCVALLVVLLGGVLLLSIKRVFGNDEFEAVHTAWKILAGEKIYVDFFQHHHPFFYYCLTPFIALFGQQASTLIIIRLFCFVVLMLTMIVTYRICMLVCNNKHVSMISALLLAGTFIFVESSIEIRPDVPQTLLGILSFYFILSYFEHKRMRNLILSGLCLGLSFLFLQKTVFLGAAIGLIFLVKLWRKEIGPRHIAAITGGFAIVVLPYFMFLLATGGLETYWRFNWLLNMRFMNRFSAIGGFALIWQCSTLLLVFYILGLVKSFRKGLLGLVGWISVLLIGSVFLVRAPYNQYFMMAMPFMAIIAANAIWSVFTSERMFAVVLLISATTVGVCYVVFDIYYDMIYVALTAVVGVVILLVWRISLTPRVREKWLPFVVLLSMLVPATWIFNRSAATNDQQLVLVDHVLSITSPDDYVYDGNVTFNLFRKDIDFFWFSVRPGFPYGALTSYQEQIDDYHYDIYESIECFEPKVIGPFYIDPENPVIADHYMQSDVVRALHIRKN